VRKPVGSTGCLQAPISSPELGTHSLARLARRLLRLSLDQRGDGLIETAVVLPVFLIIFFGITQYAIVLLTYCNATYACRLASRYASMHSSTSLAPDTVSQIQGLVTSRLFINPGITPTVSVNYYTQALSPVSYSVGNSPGYVVQVSVTWTQTLKLLPQNISTFSVSTQNDKIITR
jgi:Flp pilus assembly protein TadG